jgi:hypothetical protein
MGPDARIFFTGADGGFRSASVSGVGSRSYAVLLLLCRAPLLAVSVDGTNRAVQQAQPSIMRIMRIMRIMLPKRPDDHDDSHDHNRSSIMLLTVLTISTVSSRMMIPPVMMSLRPPAA